MRNGNVDNIKKVMETKKKTCPCCGGVLKEVFAEANYGRVLLLDQCGGCGGVWFDRWELYLLKPDEALRLDSVDLKAFNALNPLMRGTGKCPLCGKGLTEFADPALPGDAAVRRCSQCFGLWLGRGDLSKYGVKRASARGEMLKAPSETDSLVALKNLQEALDTSTISMPAAAAPPPDYSPVPPGELAKDLAPIILQILFKLIFKF
ncbi:MAG: zf-TFIIB domain-containing protein [Thermodesulfobacteriota bacterium]